MDESMGGVKATSLQRAATFVDNATSKWKLLDNSSKEREIPMLDISELTLGEILGRGAFCEVNEINAVVLSSTAGKSSSKSNDEKLNGGITSGGGKFKFDVKGQAKKQATKTSKESEDDHILDNQAQQSGRIIQDREFIAGHCIRNGDARYAIKRIAEKTLNSSKDHFVKGVVDLVIERRILMHLNHPNIIKMRATGFGKEYKATQFLVLDRLYDTLSKRLFKWKKDAAKIFVSAKKKKEMRMDRLRFAFDLCSAFQYMHGKRIIYRDLKPDNVGFDVRGDIKLFDFGLAKELPSTPAGDGYDDVYKLSGFTGSLRYMAPEVAKSIDYNLKADVYAFAVLMWEMYSLLTPYEGFNMALHDKHVVNGNFRPKLNPKWPTDIRLLLENSWTTNVAKRFTINDVYNSMIPIVSDDVYNGGEMHGEEMNRTQHSL